MFVLCPCLKIFLFIRVWFIFLLNIKNKTKKANRKRGKTRDWIKRREERGAYVNIVNELSEEDSAGYKEINDENGSQHIFAQF